MNSSSNTGTIFHNRVTAPRSIDRLIRSHRILLIDLITSVCYMSYLLPVLPVLPVLPALLSLLHLFDRSFDRIFDPLLSLNSICLSIYLSSVFLLHFFACWFSKATICQDNLRKKTVIICHSPRIIIKESRHQVALQE